MKLQPPDESMPILILMATYNGGLYLDKQIQSLLNQTYTNWELIIRDDGSSDDTVKIIRNFEKSDSRILYIHTETTHRGSCANFSELYRWIKINRETEYLMFCDQDDIWLSDKIEISLDALKQTEKLYKNTPCLVYGALQIMNESGHELKEEINYINFAPKFNNIIVVNPMFGCTMMLNKALISTVTHIPANVENHDYWIALVAVFFGNCGFIPSKIILYRQHRNNVSSQGAGFKKRFNRYFDNKRQVNELQAKILMLSIFYKEYNLRLSSTQRNILVSFLKSIKSDSPFYLMFIIIKYKIYKVNFLQNSAFFYIFILNFKKLSNYTKQIL